MLLATIENLEGTIGIIGIVIAVELGLLIRVLGKLVRSAHTIEENLKSSNNREMRV